MNADRSEISVELDVMLEAVEIPALEPPLGVPPGMRLMTTADIKAMYDPRLLASLTEEELIAFWIR